LKAIPRNMAYIAKPRTCWRHGAIVPEGWTVLQLFISDAP
jgi:hypothetical protein